MVTSASPRKLPNGGYLLARIIVLVTQGGGGRPTRSVAERPVECCCGSRTAMVGGSAAVPSLPAISLGLSHGISGGYPYKRKSAFDLGG
jgi:hypothetical protein